MDHGTIIWLALIAIIGLLAGIKSLLPTFPFSLNLSSAPPTPESESLTFGKWFLAAFFFLWAALLGSYLLVFQLF